MELTKQKTNTPTPATRELSQPDNFPKPEGQKSVKTPFPNVPGGYRGCTGQQRQATVGVPGQSCLLPGDILTNLSASKGDKMTTVIDDLLQESINGDVERALFDKKLHSKALVQFFKRQDVKQAILERASLYKDTVPAKAWGMILRNMLAEYAPGDRANQRDISTKVADIVNGCNDFKVSAALIETKVFPLFSELGLLVKADQDKGNSPWLWAYIEYVDTLTKVKTTASEFIKAANQKDPEAAALLEQQRKEHIQRQMEVVSLRMKERGERIKTTLADVEALHRDNANKQRELSLQNRNWFTENSGAVVVGAFVITALAAFLGNTGTDNTPSGAMTSAQQAQEQAEVYIGKQPTAQDLQHLQAQRMAIYAAKTGGSKP